MCEMNFIGMHTIPCRRNQFNKVLLTIAQGLVAGNRYVVNVSSVRKSIFLAPVGNLAIEVAKGDVSKNYARRGSLRKLAVQGAYISE